MRKELANYLFSQETLYFIPTDSSSKTMAREEDPAFEIPTTPKKHVWCFGEKPVDEKRELMVKLLQACQLKGAEVEFYFSSVPIQDFLTANPHLKTLLVFGDRGGAWPSDWSRFEILDQRGIQSLFSYSLDELVQNRQQEKRNFWNWLKKLYGLD